MIEVIVVMAIMFVLITQSQKDHSIHVRMLLKALLVGAVATIFFSVMWIFIIGYYFSTQGNSGWLEYLMAAGWALGITTFVCGTPFALIKLYKMWYAYEKRKS